MADLILTIPSGLDRSIFPWCTAVLRDYLKNSRPEIDVHIWDLRNEDKILVLFEEYGDCISKAVSLLEMNELVLSKVKDWEHYRSIMVKFGSDIFPVLRNESGHFDINSVNRYEEQLNELKQKFESFIFRP